MSLEFCDLKRLFAIRERMTSLMSDAPSQALLLSSLPRQPFSRLGVLCGSFNPPTIAHIELAIRAAEEFRLDKVLFTIAKVTVGKEEVTGMTVEDRLMLLLLCCREYLSLGVSIVNRGLYFEQVQAFRSSIGRKVKNNELFFIIGMDKLIQILDPRYYVDRTAALGQLFEKSTLVVANRGDLDKRQFDAVLNQPANRIYRRSVRFLALPATVNKVSSTDVRRDWSEEAELIRRVPKEVSNFIREMKPYAFEGPSASLGSAGAGIYKVRSKLFEQLTSVRPWAEDNVDFCDLLSRAMASGRRGYALRHAANGEELQYLINAR